MPLPRYPGTLHRRSFLHAGLTAFGSLTLADLLRLEAHAGTPKSPKSMIVLWLWGGPSHTETFTRSTWARALGTVDVALDGRWHEDGSGDRFDDTQGRRAA